MNDGITIQINSVAALERLLGGDKELKVSLRHAVVAAMSRNHITAEVAGLEIVQTTIAQTKREITTLIKDAIQKELTAQFGELSVKKEAGTYYTKNVTTAALHPAVQEAVEHLVKSKFSEIFNAQLEEAIQKLNIPSLIDQRVQSDVKNHIATAVRAKLQQALA